MPRLIRLPEVIERTGLSRSTIYLMLERGAFPKPAKLNLRVNGWLETEIADWIDSRLNEREAA